MGCVFPVLSIAFIQGMLAYGVYSLFLAKLSCRCVDSVVENLVAQSYLDLVLLGLVPQQLKVLCNGARAGMPWHVDRLPPQIPRSAMCLPAAPRGLAGVDGRGEKEVLWCFRVRNEGGAKWRVWILVPKSPILHFSVHPGYFFSVSLH